MNWKTNAAGAAIIFTALGSLLGALSSGNLTPDVITQVVTAFIAGAGFFFAKDAK